MRAWASVLTETNSIPSTPASIIRLTALPPAPPMPTTLMCAKVSRITSSQDESRARAGAATGLAGTGVGVGSAGGSGTGAAISRGAAVLSKVARGRSLRWPSGCGGRRWPRTGPWLWDCMLLPHPGTRTPPLAQGTRSARPAGAPEGCAIRHRGEGDARGVQDSTNVPGNTVRQIGALPNPAVRLVPRSNALPEYNIGPLATPLSRCFGYGSPRPCAAAPAIAPALARSDDQRAPPTASHSPARDADTC